MSEVGIGIAVIGLIAHALGFGLRRPVLEIVGQFFLFVGAVLIGVALMRVRRTWPGLVLVVASVLFFFGNSETWTAWLWTPFGAAWVVLGYLIAFGPATGRSARTA